MTKFYTTFDLCLASTLSLWFPVETDKTKDPKRVLFVFKDSPKLQCFIKKYWNGAIRIEPRKYFDNLKALKARLYSNE